MSEKAGDWTIDELLLTALGFGDLGEDEKDGSAEAGSTANAAPVIRNHERHNDALVALAADREARARDPVVLYLEIHSNSVAHAVAEMVQAHQDEWPAPSPEISWGDVSRFTRKLVRTLCPVVRDDSFALFQLVHPLSPEDAYRRHVAGARVARTTWLPGFGEAVAAQVKAATFLSIARLGARFQTSVMQGDGGPPASEQILTSHPLDTYVRSAMGEEGVLDTSGVWQPASSTKASGHRRAGAAAQSSPLTVQWLGREDATLWNYVRVSPAGATVEAVAATLYGSPAQSRMAFALRQHGSLFQVAPKQARELIASRYPGEVTGHGTARDGAALARSPLGDEIALHEASPATSANASSIATATSPRSTSSHSTSEKSVASAAISTAVRSGDLDGAGAPSLPQLLDLHFSILAQLGQLRADVAPLGLAAKLDPAFAFRARTMLDVTHAGEAERRQWQLVWHAQHVHLMMISRGVAELTAQTQTSPARLASLRDRISKYLAAAAVSHLQESCAGLLSELAAARRQDLVDQATDAQIGLRDAMRQADVTPGQIAERGSAEADATLTHEQARVLRGGDSSRLQGAQLAAEEVALRTRLQTVRLALLELGLAADEAGAGLSAELARCCSGKFRRLPALIDAVQLRLLDVEHGWAAAERAAPQPAVVADEREEERSQRQARVQGLDAARQAFGAIAGDRDISTFLRESQGVVSSQRFRSSMVQLAGALVLTVATSGVAAELGAGLAGLVGAGEAGGAITAGAVAARAGGLAINLAVNVTVNSAVQYAMSEGHEAMGWALVENALMELATRSLGLVLKAPMAQLRSLEQQALREGNRLRQLAGIERDAARNGATMSEALVQERNALRQVRADRAGWFVIDLTTEMVLGMASQWAARSLLQVVRGPSSSVSDDFATNVLHQGAAIMLGKRLSGLKAAWKARRAELEAQQWFTRLPHARALMERRAAFFGEADALAHSLSPDPEAGPRLLAHHEELVRLEQELVARGEAEVSSSRSGDRRDGHLADDAVARPEREPSAPRAASKTAEPRSEHLGRSVRSPGGTEPSGPVVRGEHDEGSQRATGEMSAVDPHAVEVARIRNGPPGVIRSEAELSNADVALAMNAQLRAFSAEDVQNILMQFPEAQRAQARYVLARSSQFGNMEAWNALRLAMEPLLARGGLLYVPGSGSLADNVEYVSSKKSFREVPGVESKLVTTRELQSGAFLVLDAVILHKLRTQPAFAKRVTDLDCRLLEPRGFNEGINLYNSPSPESVVTRTETILGRARALSSDGSMSFEKAVDVALGSGTRNALDDVNPGLHYLVKEVDARKHPDLSDKAMARQLNGDAGISEQEVAAQLGKVSLEHQDYARELMARQSEIYSSRRFASELADQHQVLMAKASERGVSPDQVFFYIPESGKSYGMIAMAHREATGTAVDRYINGLPDLKRRKLSAKTAIVIFDDVAGSGMSLQDATSLIGTSYGGTVLVSPMVSTEVAKSKFDAPAGGISESGPNVAFEPRSMSRALTESFFFQSLASSDQKKLRSAVGQKGFGTNALSMAFPYMAPDNNNALFGDLIARFFMLNRNRAAAKSPEYTPAPPERDDYE